MQAPLGLSSFYDYVRHRYLAIWLDSRYDRNAGNG